MNPNAVITIITGLGAVLSVVLAMWTMLANFDKRNADRFDAMQKQIDGNRDALQKQIESVRDSLQKEIASTKEVLRAEMKTMGAELRLEIHEAGRIVK